MTIAQEQVWFTRALATARGYGVDEVGGRQRAGITGGELAAQLYPHIPPGSGITRTDILSASRRAITAYEQGVRLARERGDNPQVRDIPQNYGLRANQSRFEYRVVVRRQEAGVTTWETMVVLRSGRRLTADEVETRALLANTVAQGLSRNYDARLRTFSDEANVNAFIVAISQRTPGQDFR